MVKFFAMTMFYVVCTVVVAIGGYVLIIYWDVFTPSEKAFIFSISTILISFYTLIWGIHVRRNTHGHHLPNDEAGH